MARSNAARPGSAVRLRPTSVAAARLPLMLTAYLTTPAWIAYQKRVLRLRLDPITRGWALVTSAGVVRLGLGFVASLLIARALGPADFGVYAVLAATVGIVAALAEGGLTEAAVLRISSAWPASDRAEAHTRAFFWLRLGVSALVVGIGCALAAWL